MNQEETEAYIKELETLVHSNKKMLDHQHELIKGLEKNYNELISEFRKLHTNLQKFVEASMETHQAQFVCKDCNENLTINEADQNFFCGKCQKKYWVDNTGELIHVL